MLSYAWTFYYLMHRQKSDYVVHKFCDMHTIADFWAVQKAVHKCSRLDNADYFVFKTPVKPKWEDAYCKSGGRWIAKFEKVNAVTLDDIWLKVRLVLY